jgi:hypothetical protein
VLETNPALLVQPDEQYRSGSGEMGWEMLDDEQGMTRIERATEEVRRANGTKGEGADEDS